MAKHEAGNMNTQDALYDIGFTHDASRFTLHASRNSGGFTLLAMIGILAIMTILAAVMAPSLVAIKDRQTTDQELDNLRGIGEGTELYLRQNRAWAPTLVAHSPNYVPLDSAQLLQNPRGFPRYYAAHPTTASFNNAVGLAESDLIALRFLLVSDVSQDAAPTITNATEFETWWATDETATPDLKIFRGNLATLFHQVSLTALYAGGSYQIDGQTTESAGGTLADYSRYHATGTVVALDEDSFYGTPEVQFALTGNVAYQYDPTCSSGSRWKIAPETRCTCPLVQTLSITNGGFETGDLTGWTKTGDLDGNRGNNRWGSVTSSLYMTSAPSGTYFANGEATGATGSKVHTTGISQRIDVSECSPEIDVEELQVSLTALGHGESGPSCWSDLGWVRIEFYDAVSGGSQVGSAIDSKQATTQASWDNLSIPATTIPATTRSIEVLALGSKPACGSQLNAGVDDIDVVLLGS